MVEHYREILQAYFKEYPFVESNIQSFNDFVEKQLQKIIDETGDIIPTIIPQEVESFVIKFKKIWVEKPSIIEADGSKRDVYPSEARLRSLTYSAPMYLEVSAYVDEVQRENFVTMIGKLPIMLKSKYCNLHGLKKDELVAKGEDPNEPGGYFIINGNERVLVTVEDLASNKIFVEYKGTGPSEYAAKLFSEMGSYRIAHTLEQMKDGLFYLTFTRFKRVPLVPILKALGMIKDQEIVKMICAEEQYDSIFINLYDAAELKNEEDALEYLARKIGIAQTKEIKVERTREQLDKYLLPHLGITAKERLIKAYTLCKMIRKFLLVAEEGKPLPDKDHYMNKRLKLSGDLLEDLIRTNLRSLVQDIMYNFQRLVKRGKFQSIKIIIRDELLTSNIKSALATGSWTGGRKGISQNIERTNMLAAYSHLQRIVSLLTSTQENFAARALHPSHWGRLCLKKDTNVLLADKYSTRTLEQLQNCWKHHKVGTLDIGKLQIKHSAVARYFASNPKLMSKKVFKLTSESGRSIVATEDHPFYTPNGWLDASKINKGDLVAVYPTLENVETPNPPSIERGKIIVDEENIKSLFRNRCKHYTKELKERELLPFTINNYWAEIIVRLIGHLFSDGHCGKNNLEFYCGSLEDAKKVAEDIRLLGFEPSKIMKKNTKIKIDNKIINYTTYVLTKGGSLHALLVALGVPVGKKVDINYSVHGWIFDAKLSVKREFLAALLGGGGAKPTFSVRKDRRSGIKLHYDNYFVHKNIKLKENGTKFIEDIKNLFTAFGINATGILVSEDYIRKDGGKMLKLELNFNKSHENIMNLLNNIGYRYCKQKENAAMLIGEWLRLRKNAINSQINKKNEVKRLYLRGLKPKQISKVSGINYRKVNAWLFVKRYEKTRWNKNLSPDYNEWLASSTKGLGSSGFIWEKITDKGLEDIDDVRDLTLVEDTHNFIANGFLTHNCPIETPEGTPIGLRKNLAILCTISRGDMQEDKIKKSLENLGVKSLV